MGRSKRSLTNVTLTSAFHFRYLGLWALIAIGLLAGANLLLFFLTEAQWQALYSLDTQFHEEYMDQRRMMVILLGFEMLLLTAAIVLLAKFTAHRIAGPYIKLQQVFESVGQGNLDQKLHFRKYDHLEDLETAFNEMMVTVRARTKAHPPVETP